MDKRKKYIKIFLIAIFDSIAFCLAVYCGNLVVREFYPAGQKVLIPSAIVALLCILTIIVFINTINKYRPNGNMPEVIILPFMVIMITTIGTYHYTSTRSELSDGKSAKLNEETYTQTNMTESNSYDVFIPDYVANDIKFTINDLVLISNYIAHSDYANHIRSLKFDSYSVSDDMVTLIVTNQDNFKYMIDVDKDRNISMSEYKGSLGDNNLPGTPIYKFSEEDKARFNDYVHQLPDMVSAFTVNSVEEKSCCYYVFYLDENNIQCYLRYDKEKAKVTEYGTVDNGEKIKTADVG